MRSRSPTPTSIWKLIDTSVDFTKGNYEAAISTLFEGAILAVIVVLLFLRDIRATIIAANPPLPLSIFPAFWAMDILWLLAEPRLLPRHHAGRRVILVDDASSRSRTFVRIMRMGKRKNPPYRAALEAADEIGLAVIRDLADIIAIFAPASFMSGSPGSSSSNFGITVSVQVFFSLLARALRHAVLAAYFLKDHPHEDPPPGRILQSYTRLVTWSVKHYFITVLIGFGIFAASIWSITLLPQGFCGAGHARSLLAMEAAAGSQLAYTEQVTEEIARVCASARRSEAYSSWRPGAAGNAGSAARRADHQLRRRTRAKITQRELELSISHELENVPDIRFWFLDENGFARSRMIGIRSNMRQQCRERTFAAMCGCPDDHRIARKPFSSRNQKRMSGRSSSWLIAARVRVGLICARSSAYS